MYQKVSSTLFHAGDSAFHPGWAGDYVTVFWLTGVRGLIGMYRTVFFPQALLAGFSFRTGEYKAFAVRKIAAKPEQVPILHKILPGNLLGNLPGNVPGTIFGKKCENPRYFFFLTFDVI